MNHGDIRICFGRAPLAALWVVATAVGLCMAAPATAQDDVLGGKVQSATQTKTEAQIQANIERLKKQVAASPQNYRLHFKLANAYLDGGDEDRAKASFDEALRINPKYLEALVNLGGLYADLEQHEDALEYFEKALGLNPDDCKARSNLGNSYYAMERYPDAMYEYMRAVEIDSKCYSALYNIAVAFADAGLFREAVKWWERVEKVAPGTDAARNARENADILKPFTQPPPPASGEPTKDK